jgi:hypothetical protein
MISQDKHQQGKWDRCLNMGKFVPFMLSSLLIATIFGLFLLCSPNPFTIISKQGLDSVQKQPPTPMQAHESVQEEQQPDHLKPQKSKLQNNTFLPYIMQKKKKKKKVLGSN